jgi:hypothetical protein
VLGKRQTTKTDRLSHDLPDLLELDLLELDLLELDLLELDPPDSDFEFPLPGDSLLEPSLSEACKSSAFIRIPGSLW